MMLSKAFSLPSLILLVFAAGSSLAFSASAEVLLDRSSIGYRVLFLEDWTLKIGSGADGIDAYFTHTDPEVEILVAVVPAGDSDSVSVSESMLLNISKEARKVYYDVADFTYEIGEFQGVPAGLYEFTGGLTDEADPLRALTHQIIARHEDRFFLITILSAQEDLPDSRQAWEAFLGKIEFVPESP